MSRKSQRKTERELLAEALKCDTFPWDYSYFKWLDIPREVRREMVLDRSWAARTWIYGKTAYQMDVPYAAARELYNKNWDGCRDLWKELYRAKKHPGSAPAVRYSQKTMIGWFSGSYMTIEDPPAAQGNSEQPVLPPPPPPQPPLETEEMIEARRRSKEREQARRDRFNRAQQKRYEQWLAIRKGRQEGTHS